MNNHAGGNHGDAMEPYAIRNQIEAEYMEGINDAIMTRMEWMHDSEIIAIQAAVSDCRLHIMGARARTQQRIKARRETDRQRAATTARAHVTHINPRFIRVAAEHNEMSEYGKRGAMATKRARAKEKGLLT